jgi:UTP--glucose-1-phosphate uridylyltransferase
VVGNEPFAVILADDLIDNGDHSCLKQMVDLFAERGCSLLGVDQIDPAETDKYGIITPKRLSDHLYQAEAIVEKPRPDEAPSALAVVGRYILTPGIFDYLENLGKGAGGEIQLTDAIAQLMGSETVLAYEFDGIRYDCGSKLGYLQATVEYALKHPDLQRPFREYLQKFSLME